MPKLKTAIDGAKLIAEKLESMLSFKVRMIIDPTRDDIIYPFHDYFETLEFRDKSRFVTLATVGWMNPRIAVTGCLSTSNM